jgi:peptide/nickel transport system permease protein
MHLVLINFVLGFSGLVLAEAILSYLGVGSPVGTASWGSMIDGARSELSREPLVWWNLTSATAALFGLVLSLNLFGDALRRAFDPRRAG